MSRRPPNLSLPNNQATDSVEERLRRISRDILPSTPYLLTVPTILQNPNSNQANDWKRNWPFESNEERLQYLTFRSHFDKDILFHAVGDWDDGKGNIMSKADKSSGLSSPLPGQPPRKVMSLTDYKQKAAGQVNTKVAPSKPKAVVNPSENGGGAQPKSQQSSKPPSDEKSQGVKRPADGIIAPKHTMSDSSTQPPPAKKARISSNTIPASEPTVAKTPAIWSMPPMLSPTLPPEIEEELAKMPMEGSSLGSKKTNPVATPTLEKKESSNSLYLNDGPRNAKSAIKVETPAAELLEKKSAPVKDLKAKLAPDNPTPGRAINGAVNLKSLGHGANAGDKKSVSLVSATTPQRPEQKRQILKLKIPKSIRKNCIRILQMQPRHSKKLNHDTLKPGGNNEIARDKKAVNGSSQNPEQQSLKSERPKGQDTPSINRTGRRPDPLEESSNAPKSGDKRKRADNQRTTPDPSRKRQKHPGALDLSQNPHTPTRPPLKSPLVSQHNSTQKSQLSTPKRDIKGTAMHRIGSSEGDVKTPLGALRGSTPTATGASERVNRDGRSTSNTSTGGLPASKSDDVTVWRVEQRKFEVLGRTLKHEAAAALPKDGDFKNDTPSMRKGAAIAFEAILAFMLSFTISDEINRLNRQALDSTAWRSLVPYLHYVKRVTRIYRPLLGLTHQLEAICRDTIALYDADRLERDANSAGIVDEQRPSTSDSGATHPSPSLTEKAKQEFVIKHADNLRQVQHAWQLGYSELPFREMQRLFPETWDKSADIPGLGKGKEKLSAKSYGGGVYYLPLGPASSGIEGVRVGWQMLGEWSRKNEVNWQGKLEL